MSGTSPRRPYRRALVTARTCASSTCGTRTKRSCAAGEFRSTRATFPSASATGCAGRLGAHAPGGGGGRLRLRQVPRYQFGNEKMPTLRLQATLIDGFGEPQPERAGAGSTHLPEGDTKLQRPEGPLLRHGGGGAGGAGGAGLTVRLSCPTHGTASEWCSQDFFCRVVFAEVQECL